MRLPNAIHRCFPKHFVPLLLCAALLLTGAQAQTFHVLFTFTGNGLNGQPGYPASGLIMSGNKLYGTALRGGSAENGAVFQLKRSGSGWVLALLYSFQGGTDGQNPSGGLTVGPSGVLYGTTGAGGDPSCGISNGCGTVYKLRPPATAAVSVEAPWLETVLYRFQGGTDGSLPGQGSVVFDSVGNLYGTTVQGGDIVDCSFNPGCGVVYELTPSGTETVLHAFNPFASNGDGNAPYGGVIFDNAGNLYGTTSQDSIIYELSPSGGSWTESILYSFAQNLNNGDAPYTSLLRDSAGNLYGVTQEYGMSGPSGGGTAFEFSSGGLNVLHDFGTTRLFTTAAEGPLIMDSAGNLYGVSQFGGTNGVGNVYKLSPAGGGTWNYTDLYDFTGLSDGALPNGNLVMDSSGNLYGTTCCGGGAQGSEGGVIFEITP